MSAPTAAVPGTGRSGCFKCGKPGHWSRDCTVPREQWIQQPRGTEAPTQAVIAPADENTPLGNAGAPEPPPDAKKIRRKRPKLDADRLLTPAGLPEVYGTFYDVFVQQYKGPGHEAGDLRRLLELYSRWHQRFHPWIPLDTFLTNVSNIGNTRTIAHHLTTLRQSVYACAQRESDKLRGIHTMDDHLGGIADDDGGAVRDDDDDDIQRAGMVGDHVRNDPLLDDELMELAAMDPGSILVPAAGGAVSTGVNTAPTGNARGGAGNNDNNVNDDDELEALLRMPFAGRDEQRAVVEGAAMQGTAMQVTEGTGVPVGDDELEALAAAVEGARDAGTAETHAAAVGNLQQDGVDDDDMDELVHDADAVVDEEEHGGADGGAGNVGEEVDELDELLEMEAL